MNELELTARALLEAAASPDVDDLRPACAGVLAAARQSAFDDLHGALTVLTRGLDTPDLTRAAQIAVTCGALIEQGAHPEIASEALLKRLGDALDGARALLQIASDEAPGDEIDQAVFDAARARHPAEAQAWDAIHGFTIATIACLSRRAALRDAALRDKAFVDRLAPLTDLHPHLHFLALLLRVLEDATLVVVHPSTRQGWRVTLSGIADNVQLQTLLADALVGDAPGKLPGTPPAPEVVSVMTGEGPARVDAPISGWFELYQWNIIQPDGSLPAPSQLAMLGERRVWAEGAPDEIEAFEGARTLVLGPRQTERRWTAARVFPSLMASVDLEATLTAEEVDALVLRLARAAPRDA